MELISIKERPDYALNVRQDKKRSCFSSLISELGKRPLSEREVGAINNEIRNINASTGTEKDFMKTMDKSQATILKVIEKESGLVAKNRYRNLWLVLGMSAFGIPIGVAFGISMGNLGLLGLGFPIGMAIGIAVGTSLDNKAAKEGRQLDVDLSA